MGSGISYQTSIANNELLKKFVQKEAILVNDTFWNKFLSFSFRPPTTPSEHATLDEKIQTICVSLLENNLESGNFGSLLQIYLNKSTELVNSTQSNNSVFCWQTYNSLFIIRCITKFLVENIKEEDVIRHFGAASVKTKAHNDHLQKIEEFIDSLFDILVDLPNKDFTYPIHLEAINCLIILLSVHLFSQRPAANSFIYRSLIQGKYSIHAPKLMKVLLQHVADYEKAPPGLHPNNGGGSIMLGIASEIWNMLTLGLSRNSYQNESTEVPVCVDAPLASHSLLLILVLTNHCTAENPYRQALFSCTYSSADRTAPQPGGPTFKIDFAKLYTTMCKIATLEHGTLLLYLLLHRNPHFKNFVMSRSDIENLVVPILKTLYHAPDSNSHHIYMSLIILLVLSEDNLFNKTVHETMLKGVTWYTERSISEISLGGLLVLIVIRTIQYNMLKMRDKYLHTNCLAALANMSGQFRALHPYVSQRLVSLFETLSKKHIRLTDQVKQESVANANNEEGEPTEIVEDITVLEEVLRMILEILNSCLSNQLSHNPNLVYTLLYKKQIFEPYRSHPAFQDIMQNIDIVILYFSNKLDQFQNDLGVTEVLSTIQLGALQWPKERLSRFPDLKFKYVEEDQPEDFFIPYVWTLVCSCSSLYWNPSKIKLFVPETV